MEPVSRKTFYCDSHSPTVIAGLEKLWKENQFCDVTLKIQGREFSCHKNVLAANSEYFTSVFVRDFKEKQKNLIVLPSEFEVLPFQTLVEYFYSGRLVLSPENAEGVFKLADYMRLDTVIEMATQFLEETLDRSNCIRRFIMAAFSFTFLLPPTAYAAQVCGCKSTGKLHRTLDGCQINFPGPFCNFDRGHYITRNKAICAVHAPPYYVFLTNFSDTIEYKRPSGENMEKAAARLIVKDITKESALTELLELSGELVSKILTLGSKPESAEALFLFIIKWVRHDEENRRLFLRDLLQLIPVSGLSFKFYETHIKTEELLRRNLEGLEWVVDSVVHHVTNPLCVAQNPQESLFVANDRGSRNCYQLQVSHPTALPVSDRPEIQCYSAVSHKKWIYLMCGCNNEKTFRLEEGRSWVDSEVDLYFDRSHPGTIVMEDDLFVIGGWNDRNGSLNSCAKFNFATRKTVSLPNMKERKGWPGIGVFENSIYASGGWPPSMIERFDPREGQWSMVGSFNSDMSMCSSATIGNFLFTCDRIFGQVMRFDLRSNRSEEVCSLKVPAVRWNRYWITSLNDQMYAARGNRTVLKYDREGDSWSEFRSGLDLEYPIIVPWV